MKRINYKWLLLCFLSLSYGAVVQAKTAKEKISQIWEKIEKTRYQQIPLAEKQLDLSALTPDFLKQTFAKSGDKMSADRDKKVHTFGTAALVRWQAEPASPYSGLFSTGAHGIIRLSHATPPQKSKLFPAIAIKLFVDDLENTVKDSVNLMAMLSFEGQPGHDFFANSLSNVLPPPVYSFLHPLESMGKYILSRRFTKALRKLGDTGSPLALRTHHFSQVLPNGNTVTKSTGGPDKLIFQPTPAARALMKDQGRESDFRHQLMAQGKNVVLYDIYAVAIDASQREQGLRVKIGSLVAESDFVCSEYQDKTLRFQHQHGYKQAD